MAAYEFTLADARVEPRILDVAQNCSSSADFASKINSVTRMLMKRGNWWNTEVLVRLCVTGCRVVWPKYVGTVNGLRFCGFGNMEVKNNWYAILGGFNGIGNNGFSDYGAYGGYGGGLTGYGNGGWVAPTMVDRDTTPVHTQITGNQGKYLRYYIVKPQDIGKTIRIFGTQYGGQPLQELDSDGNWVNGITLTATTPYAQSTALVTRIDAVTREMTQGMSYLYQYDPAGTGTGQLQLAAYEPNETNPQYRQSQVSCFSGVGGHEGANGERLWTLDAIVKLQYFPVVNDRDFLFISDWDALAYGIQALNLDNQNDTQGAEVFFAKSIRELNMESRDRNPAQTFVVKNRSLGSQTIISNPV